MVCSTVVNRGRSLTPASRMLIDDSSSCMLVRKEATQPFRDAAVDMAISRTHWIVPVMVNVVAK